MQCKICAGRKSEVIYDNPIRDGSFGKMTRERFKVIECRNCFSRFLDPFPADLKQFYEGEKYRNQYDGANDIQSFRRFHDQAQTGRIARIDLPNLRDKVIIDFGAGGGSFLDAVVGFAKETHAVEPARFYKKELAKKHHYYASGKDFLKRGKRADVAVSFETIEHVEDPVGFLEGIFASLRSGGVLYLSTVNYDSIYNDLIKDVFDPFNYRTAHLFYFCRKSLNFLFKKVGFADVKVDFYHEYDMSNLILWLKQNKPTGLNAYKLFDEDFNGVFKGYLEKTGKASTLWVTATK